MTISFPNFYLYYVITELTVFTLVLKILKTTRNNLYFIIPFIHTAFLYIFRSHLHPVFSLTFSIILGGILIHYILRFNIIQSLIITLITFSIYIPLENMVFALFFYFSSEDYYTTLNSITYTGTILLIFLLIIFGFTLLLKCLNSKNNLNSEKFNYINWENIELSSVIIFIFIENIAFSYYFTHLLVLRPGGSNKEILLFSTALLILIIVSLLMVRFIKLINKKIDLAAAEEKINSLSNLNFALKRQLHDFKHHLQLLTFLIQMKKYDRALEYMKSVTTELNELGKISSTGIPALNGLLQYKMALAKKEDIKLQVEALAKLENLPLNPSKICRVIGNLIDNAIEYLKDKKDLEKYIQLIITDTRHEYHINLSNPVTPKDHLNENMLSKFLQPGFSTKGKNRGLGLAIVNEIIKESGGKFLPQLDEEEGILSFQIIIPKSNSNDKPF
ncbi:sensor histidine kinase [Halothermothrix orenii]|uniref:Signal transduction histidine kinase regulating citrate/malate metabolism n=1 Tax=Halothermothrix orenii (strain H 168 / OCM 544 / DSM 9562) TaxID=373903 RepID=B8CY40_HALOH|nr:Spo0B domain-containing protein [Halothermothrix orenii]ACL70209.1 signal transduction histidine kinase regulating citrate/malate metabolism [Halothermothrix orenii H 168]